MLRMRPSTYQQTINNILMRYYSTNHSVAEVTLCDAVVKGLASDRGLFMPEKIERLPESFFENIDKFSSQDIAVKVAEAFFGEDVEAEALENIVRDTLSFDTPVVKVEKDIYSLELFHGPTLAFKDVGARFMARLLQYFINKGGYGREASQPPHRSKVWKETDGSIVNVLVATSGDTGSAVANGFLGVEGIHVYVLYPKGKVSPIQECQFTTLGNNITPIEVDGNFDDCQRLVKSAFLDDELNSKMLLTSANSINVARFLPQAFYYFSAYAQLKGKGRGEDIVVCVPSGNFGNITAGLIAHRMGLPIKRFIAANNANDIFYNYLQTGEYCPKASVQTLANAMDVGDPSNFARILDLYAGKHEVIASLINGTTISDAEIAETMKMCYEQTGYVLDPHGACGYLALKRHLKEGETGLFLETAHPAKFRDVVAGIIGKEIEIPERLQEFMKGKKQSVAMSSDFSDFKSYLLQLS